MRHIESGLNRKRRIQAFLHLVLLSVVIFAHTEEISANSPVLHTNVILFSLNDDTSLIKSLRIDKETVSLKQIITPTTIADLTINNLISILEQSDVVFVDRYLPSNPEMLHKICEHINGTLKNLGAVFFGVLSKGNGVEVSDFSPEQVNIINSLLPVNLSPNYQSSTNNSIETDYKIQTMVPEGFQTKNHVLTKSIPWESCPAISYRTLVDVRDDATSIVRSIDDKYAIVSERDIQNGGTVVFYSMEINLENIAFTLWPFFNYLVFATALHVTAGISDDMIPTYQNWKYSPLPKAHHIVYWFTAVAGMWVISFYLYFYMKKRTAKDPNYSPEKMLEMKKPTSNPISVTIGEKANE